MENFNRSFVRGWGWKSCQLAMALTSCLSIFALTPQVAVARPAHGSGHHAGAHTHSSPGANRSAAHSSSASKADSHIEGFLFQDLLSGTISSKAADQTAFNPASNTKLATTLTVLQTYSLDFTFKTDIVTDGTVDTKGVLHGNLYVEGHYMLFGDRQVREMATRLNKRGIRSVTGNLYISSDLTMNLSLDGFKAANQFLKILDPAKFAPPEKTIIVKSGRSHHRRITVKTKVGGPSVNIMGQVLTGKAPQGKGTTPLLQHTSPPLKDILKVMLCYSNNEMAERFGQMVGGPAAVTKEVVSLGVAANEVSFSSTSGLGVNRISPRAMIAVVRALRLKMQQSKLELSDILTVSGVDAGTMRNRLNWAPVRGSVISKTGTLTETDNGATALSGELHTNQGIFLFVIFEINGNFKSFRQREDAVVADFEKTHGGAKAIVYKQIIPRVDGEDFWK